MDAISVSLKRNRYCEESGSAREKERVFDFNPLYFKELIGPGVYVLSFERRALYVGSAKNILHRISCPDHDSLRAALLLADQIEIYPTISEQVARHKEAQMILRKKPQLNKTGLG